LGNGGPTPKAAGMDHILHAERLVRHEKRLYTLQQAIGALPDGVMLSAGADSFLVTDGRLLRWTPAGYEAPTVEPPPPMLLTPPSTLRALAAGYQPRLHPSALPLRALWEAGRQSLLKPEDHR
jgi:hypothetical protein